MSEQQPKPSINFSSFTDWCLHKDSLCEAAKHTVEVLLNCAGTSDINEANQRLSNINKLELYNRQISDLTPLQSLTNLTELNLRDQISDIKTLQSLTNLTELYLGDDEVISDITALQSLTNLTSLHLEYDRLSDITPLQSLTNLTHLNLEYNQISDITPLQSLTNLTELKLAGNEISDFTPLQSLTNLTELTLAGNEISDITPLQDLANLTHLTLFCDRTDITPLQDLTNLTSLHLSVNEEISDITPLQFLTNLTELSLSGDGISDLTPLQFLTNLTELNLFDNNQISDITPLQFLINLTKLTLWPNNQISDITPLQSLTNLTHLNLEYNQISDITPLQSLTNLTELRVNFTPEYKALIQESRHSWESFANSTKPIDAPKATAAVKAVYDILGLEAPEITVCSSPNEALAQIQMLQTSNESEFKERLGKQVKDAVCPFSLIDELWMAVSSFNIFTNRWRQLEQQLHQEFYSDWSYPSPKVTTQDLVEYLTVLDFYVSGLGIVLKPEAQKFFEAVKQLLGECGWIFAFENVCYVCSRPCQFRLDSKYRLHAEGESAIEFPDGYKLYSYHGVTLPEKYGQVHPEKWQAQWLLQEKNSELRKLLIQRIGYDRICQELKATELDNWQEYTLLKTDFEDDFDADRRPLPVILLKMTCPSTGHIHALRVPPQVTSAQEAIRWVNWDIEPEEFSVQT